jgi:aminoglycoside phosphotransferase (APT) family kinase protein
MNFRYLGQLPQGDPLYGYLQHEIMPQLNVRPRDPGFRVFQSACSKDVYLYEEKRSGARVIGKFYPRRQGATAQETGRREYNNLFHLRSLGFAAPPHYVVRPLGYNAHLSGLLVMEFLDGDMLGTVINDAIFLGRRDRLYRKLTALAHFLATLHNRTADNWPVTFSDSCDYMGRLIQSLMVKRGLCAEHSEELYALREAWRSRGVMWEDRAVLVHGDATPSNFLFGRGRDVMAIDLERMHWADRMFDMGRLCGELKHFFCQGMGDPGAAEPFIGHFLWEYCCHFPDREGAFASITRRAPFYIGITLLRIARNSWIGQDYRWRLIQEAKHNLRALP